MPKERQFLNIFSHFRTFIVYINFYLQQYFRRFFLSAAYEVWGKDMFSQASVCPQGVEGVSGQRGGGGG